MLTILRLYYTVNEIKPWYKITKKSPLRHGEHGEKH
jgi:hypothetical protein